MLIIKDLGALRKAAAAVAVAVLSLSAVFPVHAVAQCEGAIVRGCRCPEGCDSDGCERICYALIRSDGGCLYRCEACSCGGVARKKPRADFFSRLDVLAVNAFAAEAAANEKSFSNEDGDFILVKPAANKETGDEEAGIGVRVVQAAKGIVIGGVTAEGPAMKSGLENGDEVLSIDGRSCSGMTQTAASKAIRGRSGTLVVLRVRSKKTGKIKKYSFNRVPLGVPSESRPHSKVSIKEIPLKDLGAECPKEKDGCHLLYSENSMCTFTCPAQ